MTEIDAGTHRRTELVREVALRLRELARLAGGAGVKLADALEAAFSAREPVPKRGDADAVPRKEAGGPSVTAAGAEPWPSDERCDSLDRLLSYQPSIDSRRSTIRRMTTALPPSPAHQAALERAEKAEADVVTAPYGVIGHRVCGCAPTKEKP